MRCSITFSQLAVVEGQMIRFCKANVPFHGLPKPCRCGTTANGLAVCCKSIVWARRLQGAFGTFAGCDHAEKNSIRYWTNSSTVVPVLQTGSSILYLIPAPLM